MNNWISTKKELSPLYEKVLIRFYCKNGLMDIIEKKSLDIDRISIAHRNKKDWYDYDFGSVNSKYITHWQPLPQPPKEND